MDRYNFFKSYKRSKKSIRTHDVNDCLVQIFESILTKRKCTKERKSFHIFDDNLSISLYEPLDYQFPIENKKESCMRLIYKYLSRNEIIPALNVFIHLIHNYNPNSSYVWRTGFHILSRIGDQVSMHNFFDSMLDNNVWDPSNMIYEYFLYLLIKGDYSRISEIYHNSYCNIYRSKRYIREPEMDKLHHLIKLTLATSYYCIWKQSLKSGYEDISSRTQAEIEFNELYGAINNKMIVDSYLLNYIDILEFLKKFDKALEILKLYYETCSNNCHASEYLLDFMIRCKPYYSYITEEEISKVRRVFVLKQISINCNDSNEFILNSFKKHIEELHSNGNHEELVKLLFDYLCHDSWTREEWPWKYLLNSINELGVSNSVVQESWIYIRDLWTYKYFTSPDNNSINQLSEILK